MAKGKEEVIKYFNAKLLDDGNIEFSGENITLAEEVGVLVLRLMQINNELMSFGLGEVLNEFANKLTANQLYDALLSNVEGSEN